MRTYAWPLLAALALTINACGSDAQPTTDGGRDGGDASGRGGTTARGGSGGATGGSTAGSGGATAGTGGSGASTAGRGGSTGGATAGTGGGSAGTGGGSAGTGGSTAGTGGRGGAAGSTAGTGGGSAGTGGGSAGTGGSTAGTGGTNVVPCLTAATCPGTDTLCRQRTCLGNGTCSHTDAVAGTAAEPDAVGNCQKAVCDGNGAITAAVDNGDLPVDGKACTSDVCTNGVASNPNLAPGTTCAADGSKACDATPACNTLTFRVVRVGTGTGGLTASSTAVFVEERRTDGSLVGTVPMPIAASGTQPPIQRPLTMSGTATSEGGLSLSADGRYLMLAGYGDAPGTANINGTPSAAVNRVAGRISVTGTVDTSTAFAGALSGNNVRSAASTDGAELWIAGAGSATGGVWYNRFQETTGEVHTLLSPDSIRCVSVFGNQLFGTSGSTPFVFRIGFGTPTASAQTAPALSGLPTTGTNPYAIAAFDLPGGAGVLDTLYVAEADLGIKKYTSNNGTTWSASTMAPLLNIAGNTGFRGVAGYAVGGTVTLMASTAETVNRLVVFVDTGTGTPAGTAVATAAANTVFRGVAVSPHFAPP